MYSHFQTPHAKNVMWMQKYMHAKNVMWMQKYMHAY